MTPKSRFLVSRIVVTIAKHLQRIGFRNAFHEMAVCVTNVMARLSRNRAKKGRRAEVQEWIEWRIGSGYTFGRLGRVGPLVSVKHYLDYRCNRQATLPSWQTR